MGVETMFADISAIGRDARSNGYLRYAWTSEDSELADWFEGEARRRGLDYQVDRCGNQWAWMGSPSKSRRGVVVGSHLDSVPHGGAFDGPLGVISSFLAFDALISNGALPSTPVGIVRFRDEEGARFGVACAGSRLLVGKLAPARALALRDDLGVTMAEAMAAAGIDVEEVGSDGEMLELVGCFVELHVEQGRDLVYQERPVGLATHIWPHGRFQGSCSGQANHAGTTRMQDRSDALVAAARVILEVEQVAKDVDVLATVGRLEIEPNGINAIAGEVNIHLDLRAPNADRFELALAEIGQRTGLTFQTISLTPVTVFDDSLRALLGEHLDLPLVGTGAGHDAGVMSEAGIPTAMLFV